MAVNGSNGSTRGASPGGKRFLIGTNVLFMSILAIAVVVVAQVLAFKYGRKFDWSSSGINSLSPGTERLVEDLGTPVRLTAAYFETDIEHADQSKFRGTINDLIQLFQSTNRTKVEADAIDPIHDKAELNELIERLAQLPKFQEEAQPYREAVETFQAELLEAMISTVQSELDALGSVASLASSDTENQIIAQIRLKLDDLIQTLQIGRDEVEDAVSVKPTRYSAAVSVIRSVYQDVADWLEKIGEFGKQATGLNEEVAGMLSKAGERFQPLVTRLNEERTKLPTERLELDEIVGELLQETSNALIVETDESAALLRFADVWPPANPQVPSASAQFQDRSFEGEREITSAILRMTDKQRTAVVFVRFGGSSLTEAMGFPGQATNPPLRVLKTRLEDLNFDVYEWDLQAGTTPPAMDPAPTRSIYVVFKPEEQNPFEQQRMPKPQWGPQHEKAVKDAMGDNPRALFVAGWFTGPFGAAIPATYPWASYLGSTWGIEVDTSTLILENISISPGKWAPSPGAMRQGPVDLTDVDVVSDHPIVRNLGSLRGAWPWCAPVTMATDLPEGVSVETLLQFGEREGLWGVTDIQAYQQAMDPEGMDKPADVKEGPFKIAVIASTESGKVAVTSARDFLLDRYTQATGLVPTAQGFAIRRAFPANQTLFFNIMHWLNDDESRMELGQPLAMGVLKIDNESTVRAVKIFAYAGWPAVALLGGVLAWFVRRR